MVKLRIEDIKDTNFKQEINTTLKRGLTSGFFLLETQINPNNLLDFTKKCHAIPLKEKSCFKIDISEGVRGFFSVDERKNNKINQEREYCTFEFAESPEYFTNDIEKILFAKNVIPNNYFKYNIQNIFNEYYPIIEELKKGISLCLHKNKKFLSDLSNLSSTHYRIMEYKPTNKKTHRNQLLGAHTDYECFTLILQSKPGLEVFSSKNEEWVMIPPSDFFIVLVGDMTEVFSNGVFPSCLHRTVTNHHRYSIVCFSGLNPDVIVEPLDSFGESRYKPTVYGEHLISRILENYTHLRKKYENEEYNFKVNFGQGNPFKELKLKVLNSLK